MFFQTKKKQSTFPWGPTVFLFLSMCSFMYSHIIGLLHTRASSEERIEMNIILLTSFPAIKMCPQNLNVFIYCLPFLSLLFTEMYSFFEKKCHICNTKKKNKTNLPNFQENEILNWLFVQVVLSFRYLL